MARYLAIILFSICLGLLEPGASTEHPGYSYSRQGATQHVSASLERRKTTAASASVAHGYETFTYTDANGMRMTYYLFIPGNYNPRQKYPLVLLLHGGGERANPKKTPEQNRALLLNFYYTKVWISSAIQDKWPSFILLPQVEMPDRWVKVPAATGSYTLTAQPSASLRMAKEIVDMLQHAYQGIDSHRLYVTGLSMGGYGTWEAIERWPNYFAAAAPLAGAGDPSKASALVHLPIWDFHGTQDTTVPVSGSRDMIQAIIQAGGHPRYTEYPHGGHDLWTPGKVYSPTSDPAFFTWLFSQKAPQ